MEIRDLPIMKQEDDEFGVMEYVDSLCEFIKCCDTPITLALQGEWGSGKSSFMRLMERKLCSEDVPEEERYESIWLNTWELFLEDDYEQSAKKLVLNLLEQINDHFDKLKVDEDKERRKRVFKEYIKAISEVALNVVNVDSDTVEKVFEAQNQVTSKFTLIQIKRDFEELLNEKILEKNNGFTNKAFIIYVDDLDRLEPRMAVTLLESLKNIFDLHNCIFVISIDSEVVISGVNEKYGNIKCKHRNIGRAFFDKVIQIPYYIPQNKYKIKNMVINRLKKFNYFEKEEDYKINGNDIERIFILATNKNPRTIKRLINMIHLGSILNDDLDNDSTQVKMMQLLLISIQLSFPTIYSMLSSNHELNVWEKSFYIEKNENVLTDYIKRKYSIDTEWKEVIYLTVSKDEVILNNYYRVCQLLDLYEYYQKECAKVNVEVYKILGVVGLLNGNSSFVKYDGVQYNKSSQTQSNQGEYLLSKIPDMSIYKKIMDIGCGSGNTTIKLWNKNKNANIFAFDISESQIEEAIKNYELEDKEEHNGKIEFKVMSALDISDENEYDMIFSNATLHWITQSKKMYKLLYKALKKDGVIYVHQGGKDTYKGLHDVAVEAYKNLNLSSKFEGWRFPTFYPTKSEMEELLIDVGFEDVDVECVKSDEKENEHIVDNFMTASLIYYQQAGLTDDEFKKIKTEFKRICKSKEIDKSSVRLYISARKP